MVDLDQIINDAAELVKKHWKLDDIGDPGITTDVGSSHFHYTLSRSLIVTWVG